MDDYCMACGRDTRFVTRIKITVDDGRPPNTPYRWRHVGWACDGHEDRAQDFANRVLSRAEVIDGY